MKAASQQELKRSIEWNHFLVLEYEQVKPGEIAKKIIFFLMVFNFLSKILNSFLNSCNNSFFWRL